MNNEIKQIAEQNGMSVEFVRWFFNEKKADCGEQWFLALGAMWEGWKGRGAESTAALVTIEKDREVSGCPAGVDLQDHLRQLAADNVQVRERHHFIRALAISILEHSGGRRDWRGAMEDATDLVKTVDEVYSNTPVTDAYLAGIKADGVIAALESCSDYLDTDCVMDRLDISYEDAEKRTSGAIEFHDAMVNFAHQLREGGK